MERNKWEFTPFGLEVRKKLLERHWDVKDLANVLGVKPHFLSAMLYGKKKGYRYIRPIRQILGMPDGYEAAANE